MKNSKITHKPTILVLSVLGLLALLPLLSNAKTLATSIAIVNNSSHLIRNLYLSHVNVDDWSQNQLGDATIPAGQSFNLSDVACDAQQVKVIAEDENGCFLSYVINCGENSTWTITDNTARDCGN